MSNLSNIHGCNLKLWIDVKGQTVEKPVELIELDEGKGLVNTSVIKMGTGVIKLNVPHDMVKLVCYPDLGKPFMYKNIKLDTTVTGSGDYKYRIKIKDDPVAFNRREYVRQYIGEQVVVMSGIDRGTYNCILHDISENGFALIYDKDNLCRKNDIAHLVYSDAVGDKATLDYKEYSFSLTGICIRVIQLENGSYLYGFKMNVLNHVCKQYITHKEREELKKRRNKR